MKNIFYVNMNGKGLKKHEDEQLKIEKDRVDIEREQLATKDRVDISRKEYDEIKAELSRLKEIESKYNTIIKNLINAVQRYNKDSVNDAIGGECRFHALPTPLIVERLLSEAPVVNAYFSPYSLLTTVSLCYGFRMHELKGDQNEHN